MNRELQRLAERRNRLVTLAATQRMVLARQTVPWQPRLALADRGIAAVRYVRRHPALLAGAGLLAAVLRPRLSSVWLQRGLMVWQLARSLRQLKK